MQRAQLLAILLVSATLIGTSYASYSIGYINVAMFLNPNTSVHVNETIKVLLTNASVQQYTTNRAALNLTLSNWQSLIGPDIEQHIINPKGSIYNFNFIPGPVINQGGTSYAFILMSYDVNNVTTVNQISPRVFVYTLNRNVFNFENGASGELLSPNTSLQISIPQGAHIMNTYPVPDVPASAFTDNYKNITTVSWLFGEPLSKFTFVFVINESLRDEVEQFISAVFKALGLYTYVIIAAIIIVFILYAYYRAAVKK